MRWSEFLLFGVFAAGLFAEDLPMSLPEDRELVRSVSPGFYHRGKGTPAEFVTSQLGYYNEVVRAIHRLIPERMRRDYYQTEAATLESARRTVKRYRDDSIRGFEWKEPRRCVVIPRVREAGNKWSAALILHGEIPLDTPGRASGDTVWKICYDEQFLYLRADVADADIRVNPVRPYEADSIEFFIRGSRKLWNYWEIVAAPGVPPVVAVHVFSPVFGQRLTQFGIRPEALRITSGRTVRGFFAECTFPFSALPRLDRHLPYSGGELEFMFVRTDLRNGRIHKSSPVPLLYDGHNVFGYMIGVLE